MISPRSIASVFRFETRKAATLSRMAWWVALAFFPVVLVFLLQWADDTIRARQADRALRRGEVPVETYEIRATSFDEKGTPAIDVDGKISSGFLSTTYLAAKSMEGRMAAAKKAKDLGLEADRGGGGGRRRRKEPDYRPELVVSYPDTIEKDDKGLRRARRSLRNLFSSVTFRRDGDPDPPSMTSLVWGAGLFVLLPSVVAMLSTFLWSAPAIGSELEGRSWAYIATRPQGPVSVLLGKYLVGVAWGVSAAMTGLILSLLIVKFPEGFMHLFKPLAILILVACPAYGAIFTLIGAIAPRRAMVVSVAYAIALEGMVSFLPVLGIPAFISRITIQYPMRSMMARWLQLDLVPEDSTMLTQVAISDSSMVFDLGSIALITILALAAAVYVLLTQELTAADESDA